MWQILDWLPYEKSCVKVMKKVIAYLWFDSSCHNINILLLIFINQYYYHHSSLFFFFNNLDRLRKPRQKHAARL